ncbi:MAG: hypothetical protein KC609_02110, partial [Myxococcales bacterium]|nr:hypothetical protein [Myxococcales bacterium]
SAAEPLADRLDFDLERWMIDVELTCIRCGLFVCDDAEVALYESRSLALHPALTHQALELDLARYLLSDDYHALRRAFSIAIG